MSFDPDTYGRWRANIPFTDDEIADAILGLGDQDSLKDIAARARRGHLSAAMYRLALPSLVKKCALCGKKALWRYGPEGRCRDHKDIMSTGCAFRVRHQDCASGKIESAWKARDMQEKRRRSAPRLSGLQRARDARR